MLEDKIGGGAGVKSFLPANKSSTGFAGIAAGGSMYMPESLQL